MHINKFLPFALLYFFVNSIGLPLGLTFTALLSPLFYFWIAEKRRKEILVPFFACFVLSIIIHFLNGVSTRDYLVSFLNYTAVYIFCQAFYTFLKECKHPEIIFRKLLIINFILILIAIPVYFSGFATLMWAEQALTDGVENFRRLKLFTYEASYYAILFTPLFFFYLLQIILRQNTINAWLLLLMIVLPYVLSFSIGVIGSICCSLLITHLIYFRRLTKKKRVINLLIIFAATVFLAGLVLVLFFPANSLFIRIGNIMAGEDTSGNGRTSDAFFLAQELLKQKSVLWGIGPGQIKLLGADIIRSYYLYDLDYNSFAIPNAAAETLAIFGWAGLAIRLLVEIILFFATKVWTNYYRLMLFLFIFLYQFTGSFITNIAEYVLWILAFTNVFTAFNSRSKSANVYQSGVVGLRFI